jgi:two-component sensor histidine kinase
LIQAPIRILLVEDNAGDARLIQEMFSTERPGSYELTHLSRLSLALEHLTLAETDIVLLDLSLPDGEGLDNVRRVHGCAPHIPLVVITGRDDDNTVAEAMAVGAQDYLVKGQIETRALPRALRHAIERSLMLNRLAQANVELLRRVNEKDLLLSEIHHRVKNSLQIVISLLSLESDRIEDPSVIAMLQSAANRVRSMASIHQTLYQSKDFAHVDFQQFLQSFAPTLVQSYSIFSDQIALDIQVAEVRLPIDAAIPCGLMVNELISNALKHAVPQARKGTISVKFSCDADDYATLSVGDDGVGIPAGLDFDNSGTLGVQLIALLAGQVGGTVRILPPPENRFEIRFPIVEASFKATY